MLIFSVDAKSMYNTIDSTIGISSIKHFVEMQKEVSPKIFLTFSSSASLI
jgi:hypothetical protein